MSHYLTLKKIGQAVAYYPNLTKKLGNVNASILLSQFIYWHDKTEHLLGVYKTQDEIKAETGLSRKEQETGRKVLRELGLITETYKRTEHKLYFLFHPDVFDEWFNNEAMPESDIRECHKVALPMPESDIPPMPESDIRYLHKSTNENTQESHAPAQNSDGFIVGETTQQPTQEVTEKMIDDAIAHLVMQKLLNPFEQFNREAIRFELINSQQYKKPAKITLANFIKSLPVDERIARFQTLAQSEVTHPSHIVSAPVFDEVVLKTDPKVLAMIAAKRKGGSHGTA